MKNYSNPLFYGLALYEGFMAIPIIGAFFVIGYGYTPLAIAFILHVVALVLSVKENRSKAPSILGMITSVIAIIPFVGMTMHFITAIVYLVSAVGHTKSAKRNETSIY